MSITFYKSTFEDRCNRSYVKETKRARFSPENISPVKLRQQGRLPLICVLILGVPLQTGTKRIGKY